MKIVHLFIFVIVFVKTVDLQSEVESDIVLRRNHEIASNLERT